MHVYDGKYYTPHFDTKEKSIFGYPPNADVVKQVAYLKGIKSCLSPIIDKLIYKIAFLLPEIKQSDLDLIGIKKDSSELYTEIGFATQADFNGMATNLLNSVCFAQATPNAENNKIDNDAKVSLYMVNCAKLYDMYLNRKKFIKRF